MAVGNCGPYRAHGSKFFWAGDSRQLLCADACPKEAMIPRLPGHGRDCNCGVAAGPVETTVQGYLGRGLTVTVARLRTLYGHCGVVAGPTGTMLPRFPEQGINGNFVKLQAL